MNKATITEVTYLSPLKLSHARSALLLVRLARQQLCAAQAIILAEVPCGLWAEVFYAANAACRAEGNLSGALGVPLVPVGLPSAGLPGKSHSKLSAKSVASRRSPAGKLAPGSSRKAKRSAS